MSGAVRLLKPWRIWSKGHVLGDPPQALAEDLVRRGFAEFTEAAVRSPVAEVMNAGGEYLTRTLSAASDVVKRSRGRPRKPE